MAARKDLLTRLADAGEEAIGRLAKAPGAEGLLGVANNMRDRIDELQKKVRGLEDLERRVAALEQQVAAGSTAKPPATRGQGAARPRKAAPKKPTTSGRRTGPGSTEGTGGASPG